MKSPRESNHKCSFISRAWRSSLRQTSYRSERECRGVDIPWGFVGCLWVAGPEKPVFFPLVFFSRAGGDGKHLLRFLPCIADASKNNLDEEPKKIVHRKFCFICLNVTRIHPLAAPSQKLKKSSESTVSVSPLHPCRCSRASRPRPTLPAFQGSYL